MSHDDIPLPTNNIRRRSIFSDHKDSQQENEYPTLNFPVENSELYYPIEYIEKVKTETELWKMYIKKTLGEMQKFKAEKKELQSTTVDENILSVEQMDFLTSFKFDDYIRRVKSFCDRFAIVSKKIQYKAENDIASQLLTTQSKLEKEIIKKYFKYSES